MELIFVMAFSWMMHIVLLLFSASRNLPFTDEEQEG